jgi:hypothetical protein
LNSATFSLDTSSALDTFGVLILFPFVLFKITVIGDPYSAILLLIKLSKSFSFCLPDDAPPCFDKGLIITSIPSGDLTPPIDDPLIFGSFSNPKSTNFLII